MSITAVDQPIRVLLVDDDPDDYVLTRDLLLEAPGGPMHVDWVQDFDAAIGTICNDCHDVVLLDYNLGARTGLELLQEARRGKIKESLASRRETDADEGVDEPHASE